MTPYFGERRDECRKLLEQGRENTSIKKSQPRESNPQPPHYEPLIFNRRKPEIHRVIDDFSDRSRHFKHAH